MCRCKIIKRVKPPKVDGDLRKNAQGPTVIRGCEKEATNGDAVWARLCCALEHWTTAAVAFEAVPVRRRSVRISRGART